MKAIMKHCKDVSQRLSSSQTYFLSLQVSNTLLNAGGCVCCFFLIAFILMDRPQLRLVFIFEQLLKPRESLV